MEQAILLRVKWHFLQKLDMFKLSKYFGPSTFVTAAFIGPGTLTVCTISGATHGYTLIWVLVFATLTTIILQEMAARLGLITQHGLGEAIRKEYNNPLIRLLSIGLVFLAIIIGNAAYEAGNISGSVLGLNGLLGVSNLWPVFVGAISFGILLIGKFRVIERILIGLVMVMSLVFIITAVITQPDLTDIVNGLFPKVNAQNQLSVLALVGTTVVPYNLFLHASLIQTKWKHPDQLNDLRKENTVAIILGGLISVAIVITSAATLFGRGVDSVLEMAVQLEPVLGSWAKYFLGVGLFASGISSAITAPLAAAYTAKGIFGWSGDTKNVKFRMIWFVVLLTGTVFSMIGYQPITVIQVAQIANGVLLPVVVFFLVYVCNRKDLLGKYVNRSWQNALAIPVILVSLVISFRSLNSVFHFI